MDILHYQQEFLNYLQSKKWIKDPKNLYEPIDYILHLGGKRMRPILTLMAADIFSSNYKKALPAALAVEVFHNFTLVHDDIMDDAPLRRGKATVHEKWDISTGILSGDAMLILAYQYFENYEPIIFQKLAKLFSKTALRMIAHIGFPMLVGALFVASLTLSGPLELTPGVLLIFYGLGLINGSKYTLNDIRVLGIVNVALGILALFFIQYGLYFWAAGFGLGHIVYGAYMAIKYEK